MNVIASNRSASWRGLPCPPIRIGSGTSNVSATERVFVCPNILRPIERTASCLNKFVSKRFCPDVGVLLSHEESRKGRLVLQCSILGKNLDYRSRIVAIFIILIRSRQTRVKGKK